MDDFDFEGYVEPVSESDLATIQRKAKEAKAIADAIAEQEEGLKQLKDRQRQILSHDLPELLSNAGMSELTLEDGTKFKVQEILNATVPKDEAQRKALFAWLADNGGGDIIKTDVTVPFEKRQHNEALSLAAELTERGLPAQANETTHHHPFLKFLREASERGDPMPSEDICPVYMGKVVKIK